jgi:hypothetical protein
LGRGAKITGRGSTADSGASAVWVVVWFLEYMFTYYLVRNIGDRGRPEY